MLYITCTSTQFEACLYMQNLKTTTAIQNIKLGQVAQLLHNKASDLKDFYPCFRDTA